MTKSDLNPQIIIDTNILLNAFIEEETQAALLFNLAGKDQIRLTVPEIVLQEFRGTAIRKLRENKHRLQEVRETLNKLDAHAEERELETVRDTLDQLDRRIKSIEKVDNFIDKIRDEAEVVESTAEEFRSGYLRWLSGRPPDKEREGMEDCIIFETVLKIGRDDQKNIRPRKVLLTADDDFDNAPVKDELDKVGFSISTNVNKLYGELQQDT